MERMIRFALISLAGSVAFAGPKVASDMPKSTPDGMVEVIVQYRAVPGRTLGHEIAGAGQVHRSFRSIPAVHMTVPLSSIASIAANPRVAYISPNRNTVSTVDVTAQSVEANKVWQSGWEGTGVGIAVIDSGVALKQDLTARGGLESRVVFSESFIAPDPS